MKKTFITTFTVLALMLFAQANASQVIMDYQGETIVRPNSIERNLLINSDDGGDYDIAIKPLEDGLIRSDGGVVIPLQYVYINNTHEDVYMRYNEYSYIFKNLRMGGVPRNMTLKVRGFGMVPAGTYNLNVEIQAVDPETRMVIGTSVFNLQIIVPKVQDISFHGATANISIGPNNAFVKNQKIAADSAPMLYINSNADWVLTLDTTNLNDDAANYYIRTVSASANVRERLQEGVLLTQGKEIIIARGKAPANNEYVSIECSAEGKNGEIIRAGNYVNRLRFRLSEDR